MIGRGPAAAILVAAERRRDLSRPVITTWRRHGGHLTGSREADSAGSAGEQNPLTGQVEVVVPIVQPRSNGVADAAEPADDGRLECGINNSVQASCHPSQLHRGPAARSLPCPR